MHRPWTGSRTTIGALAAAVAFVSVPLAVRAQRTCDDELEALRLELASPPPEITPLSPVEIAAAHRRLAIEDAYKRAAHARSAPPSSLFGLMRQPAVVESIGVPPDLAARVGVLDQVAREACARSILEELSTIDLPEPKRSVRVAELERSRASLVAGAERLVRNGVLSEDQWTQVARLKWRRDGLTALAFDVDLAALVGLSPRQQAAIRERYAEGAWMKNHPDDADVEPFWRDAGHGRDPALVDAARRNLENRARKIDEWIVDDLTPKQLRRWRDLLASESPQASPRKSRGRL